MRNFKNIINKFWVAGMVILLMTSCDLGLQEKWEYVPEPLADIQIDMTALEWMQKINADPFYNDENDSAEFTYMLKAIARTGMEAEFSKATTEQTFFLLRNAAWNGNNQIMQHMSGSASNPLDSIQEDERLRHLLNYHILPNEAIDQGASIPKSDFHFYFQTLVPGDTGVMEINRRLWNSSIRINQKVDRIGSPDTDSSMPSTAKGTTVYLHNYRFTNGIGHQLNSYVRYQPF